MPSNSLADLEQIFSSEQIKTDEESLKIYGLDWTKFYIPNPQAIVFPSTSLQIQKLVHWARKTKTSLVASGGRTGLSGGAVAKNKEVVVSFDRMSKILELSASDAMVKVQAGVITENLQTEAKNAGLYFPVDFASRGSSQIGGNIATNAGGINVIRYGMIRDWIVGLQVVTGAGEILELNGPLLKNNSGYDLKHLFIGSEGTLGFITEATIRLTKPPKDVQVLLLAAPALENAIQILEVFRKAATLTAFEFFSDLALDYVLKQSDLSPPFEKRSPYYFVIEFEAGNETEIDEAMKAFEFASEKNWISDGLMSQNENQRKDFWKYRELISESLSKYKPVKSDISVRVSDIPAFVKEADKILFAGQTKPAFEIVWFGHIGDGNLHINLLCPPANAEDAIEKLFALVKKFRGSISAEHGIGLTKKPYLNVCRSADEIEKMKGIKKVFDPDLILNPGKIFDLA